MSTLPRIVILVGGRHTCDGHMLSGRPATTIIEVGGQPRITLCNECVAVLQEQLGHRPTSAGAPKPFDTETLGEGKGPDFRMLPVTPTRVRS